MASRNYYVVLGVTSTETEEGIRAAFRDLVKRHHPDIVGTAGARSFRDIKEAYEVLADPRRRSEYDAELMNTAWSGGGNNNDDGGGEMRASNQRGFVREHSGGNGGEMRASNQRGFVRELSLRRDLAEVRPSRDEIFARLERNFTGLNVPKGECPMELTVDVALSTEEARAGTRVRLGVPVFFPCTRCGGRGCFACHGQGTQEHERPTNIDIPPMSGSGATFVVPLSGLGIHNFFLNVRVRVDRTVEPADES